MAEYLQFGDSDAFLADAWVVPDGDGYFAFAEIYAAYGRGDEMMKLIAQGLIQKARELGGPITHEYQVTNERAKALVERTEGYVFVEINSLGHAVYKKTYQP